MSKQRYIVSILMILILGVLGNIALAASDLGTVASNVQGTFTSISSLITGAAYVVGMGYGVAAVAKFKQHKDNPNQTPLSQPMVFLLVGISLMFATKIFEATGQTMFGTNKGTGVGGASTFGGSGS